MNPHGIDYPNGQRRYCKGGRLPEVNLEWVRVIEDKIFDLWYKYGHQDIPIPRCITEVGWGKECQRRAAQHLVHEATNGLFGVVTEYPGEFHIQQYQMVRLADGEHVAPMEVYCSMIASSYWFSGGANPYPAGSVKQSGKGSVFGKGTEASYARNAAVNEADGPFDDCLRVDEGKHARLRALLTVWKMMPELQKTVAEDREKTENNLEIFQRAQGNVRLERDITPLRQAYEAFRESVQSAGIDAPLLQLTLLNVPSDDVELAGSSVPLDDDKPGE